MNRRRFLQQAASCLLSLSGVGVVAGRRSAMASAPEHAETKRFGMAIDVDKCIGCARCMEACKIENSVPPAPFFFRTWVERYVITEEGEAVVSSLGSPSGERVEVFEEQDRLRSFFVPKLCNQCENPPCVQVCPVQATFKTPEGVVLVDSTRCIGCRYCIQACPYGARYLHPVTKTADKCTFCYQRVTKDLLPACVEVCPTQARIFGDTSTPASPLERVRRMNKIHVLKAHLNTNPKVIYANLDGEVR
jgi:tetrathionate reductase subunit B